MKWLLWREYRLNRWALRIGVMAVMLPCLIAFLSGLGIFKEAAISEAYAQACIWTGLLSELTIALLAGNAIAGERLDRSAEYLAYLPLRRSRLLASKLLLATIAVALTWCIRQLVLTIYPLGNPVYDSPRLPAQLLLIYGAGWFWSSVQSSSVLASTMAYSTHVVVSCCAYWTVSSSFTEPAEPVPNFTAYMVDRFFEPLFAWYATIGLPVAAVCFGIGTWIYLRGREQ